MDKKVIDKIVKLMALADNNPNAQEAQSAKEMAGRLMAKYDISIQMLSDNEKAPFEIDPVVLKRKSLRGFDTMLYKIISDFNGVGYIVQNGNKYINAKYYFIGSRSDIEANQYMIDIILRQRSSKWKEYLKLYFQVIKPTGKEKGIWMRSFAYGIGVKIAEINQIRTAAVEERGLVPVSRAKQAVAFFAEKQGPVGTGKKRKKSEMDYHGYQAGKSANLNKGIKSEATEQVTQ